MEELAEEASGNRTASETKPLRGAALILGALPRAALSPTSRPIHSLESEYRAVRQGTILCDCISIDWALSALIGEWTKQGRARGGERKGGTTS